MSYNAYTSVRAEERFFESLMAFGELMKPELTGLSVLTALFGYFLAGGTDWHFSDYVLLALGTLLVGGGAGALNQWIERDLDLLMKRTERRPLPSGRIPHMQALIFGITTSLVGNALLFGFFGLLAGILGVTTSILYLFVYTPLKRHTWHNTTVGAIPGALPVLIGWAASGRDLSPGAWLLFALVFVWQYPHFLSLAWLYRKDYAKAGFRMLSVVDTDDGRQTSTLNFVLTLGLVLISYLLGVMEGLDRWYLAGVIAGNGLLAWTALGSLRASLSQPLEVMSINRSSRYLFYASLAYLPLLMGTALLDRM